MTPEQLKAIRERVEKASPGPWVWADHDIFPEDRKAQSEGRPYWTLTDSGYYKTLCVGPIGRKMMSPESILQAGGYDGDGVFRDKEDQEFIAHARQDIPALLAYVEELEKELYRIKEDKQHAAWERDLKD